MRKFFIRLNNKLQFKWTQFRIRHSKAGRAFTKEARNTDIFGCCDILQLIDTKLALVEQTYKTWDAYVGQDYDLRNIKLVRALIKKYLEDDFFEYIWPEDRKDGFLLGAQYVCKVYVNPRTIDRILAEMDPVGAKNEKLNKWYHNHLDEVYRYKLNRLIWNILRDQWSNFNL